METFLATFTANGKFYSHLIDNVTDETFITLEEEAGPMGKRLYRVDSGANAFDANDVPIGRFIVGPQRPAGLWGFIDNKGTQIWSTHSIDEAEGLLYAEREIFAKLLEAS